MLNLGAAMGSMPVTHRMEHSQPRHGAIRVVAFEPDADYADELHRQLCELREFRLVGRAVSWDECRTLLEEQFPELLMVRTTCPPCNLSDSLCETEFPVVLGLGRKDGATLPCAFETLDLPVNPGSFREAMERLRAEIYRRKLGDLSTLLRRYLDFSRGLQRFLTAVRENGASTEIPTEHVMFMVADGNYVRLHTASEVHEIRDTMSGMTCKLDPAQFARVHRSFIVNRAHVACVRRKEGAAMAVLMSNGTEIPVGPNYRAEVESFDFYTQLSA